MLQEVNSTTIAIRLILALLMGGMLGVERGIKNRPAGMRTYMLVCIGSCMIMLMNQYIFQVLGTGDPVRMGAQVVSGIGFLGAGTIIVTKHNQIKGLTTAAGLWAAAAVGLAVGIGLYEVAVGGSIAIFVVLTLLNQIDTAMHRNTKNVELYIELEANVSLLSFMESLRKILGDVQITNTEHDYTAEDGSRGYIIFLKTKKRMNHVILTKMVREVTGIAHVETL